MGDGGKKKLRSGYTTGACAAAAAKAALNIFLHEAPPEKVSIPFPDGSRHDFSLCRWQRGAEGVLATVIKDAGDDPDVTNGAEIGAVLRWLPPGQGDFLVLTNGEGVGVVTKPGLAIAVGEPAINPAPRRMIRQALGEIFPDQETRGLEVKIFVRDGEALAQKTLNARLGIVGGLSILGTTGIVRPVSAKAWTETIEASMRVARALGLEEVLLSTGRTSEAAAQKRLALPEEAQVMMGDYLRYALQAAKRHGFGRVHLAAMWAKLIKAALAIPQTHVRNGALEVGGAVDLLLGFGLDPASAQHLRRANTAREIYERLIRSQRQDLILKAAKKAQAQAQAWSGLPVALYLVHAEEGLVLALPD